MAEERSGFLGRWSRRKLETLQGKPPDEPALADKAKSAPVAGAGVGVGVAAGASKSGPAVFVPATGPACNSTETPAVPEKSLSLDDVKALTQDSDFKPFMARNVGADVRNAAMKKLFADPHYNVMDGLDTYIDDYSIADPLPQAMLRQMASAQFLNLFDDEEGDKNQKNATARPVDMAHTANPARAVQHGAATQADATAAAADERLENPDAQGLCQPDVQALSPPDAQGLTSPDTDTAAQCAEPWTSARADSFTSLSADHASQAEPASGSGASQDHHAHSHLRLQPDHAAPAPNAGRGTS